MTEPRKDDVPPSGPYHVEVFFDGDCPLCRREIGFIRWLDRQHKILLTDISNQDFSESRLDRTYEQLMAEIHGRTADGVWITGVEVFRQIYSAVGWKWLVDLTRLPLVRAALDWIYDFFARNRLRLTGRSAINGNSCSEETKCGRTARPSSEKTTESGTPI